VKRIATPIAPDLLRSILERCESSGLPFWVGWAVSRELAETHAESLAEELEDALLALVPLARLVAWDEANDYLVPEPRRLSALAGEDESQERGEPRLRRKTNVSYEEEDEDAPPEASVPLPLSLRPEAPRVVQLEPRPRFQKRAPLFTEVDPSVVIEKGTRVRVLSGPFVNKHGIVSEIDTRGRARVRIGLLATVCAVQDLIAARDRDRKPLGSSHRRFKRTT
jgi:hypothetical protein